MISMAFKKALAALLVVGDGTDGMIRYTSHSYKKVEDQILGLVDDVLKESSSYSYDALCVEYVAQGFSSEQKEAIHQVMEAGSLAVLV